MPAFDNRTTAPDHAVSRHTSGGVIGGVGGAGGGTAGERSIEYTELLTFTTKHIALVSPRLDSSGTNCRTPRFASLVATETLVRRGACLVAVLVLSLLQLSVLNGYSCCSYSCLYTSDFIYFLPVSRKSSYLLKGYLSTPAWVGD